MIVLLSASPGWLKWLPFFVFIHYMSMKINPFFIALSIMDESLFIG